MREIVAKVREAGVFPLSLLAVPYIYIEREREIHVYIYIYRKRKRYI